MFATQVKLKMEHHKRKQKSTADKPSLKKCKFCTSQFTMKRELLKHEKSHSKEILNGEKDQSKGQSKVDQCATIKCGICGELYNSSVTHIHHNSLKDNVIIKNYECLICNKSFTSKDYLYNEHMNIHTGDRPYECELCDTSCHTSEDLSSHMKLHVSL